MIKKLIIPAAGYGTRFLPATKAVPKPLLPVLNKPSIQWVVEEAISSGIKEIICVVMPEHKTMKEHFSYNPKLVAHLKKFRILSDKFRNNLKNYNLIFKNIAGLRNWQLEPVLA